jgi:hypothetical protein
VEPFFGLWNFLRRTSTKIYGRIEVNPLAPWRVHEKSQRYPIQPYQTPLNRKTEVKTRVGCDWFSLPTSAIKAILLAKKVKVLPFSEPKQLTAEKTLTTANRAQEPRVPPPIPD